MGVERRPTDGEIWLVSSAIRLACPDGKSQRKVLQEFYRLALWVATLQGILQGVLLLFN